MAHIKIDFDRESKHVSYDIDGMSVFEAVGIIELCKKWMFEEDGEGEE